MLLPPSQTETHANQVANTDESRCGSRQRKRAAAHIVCLMIDRKRENNESRERTNIELAPSLKFWSTKRPLIYFDIPSQKKPS